MYTDLKIKYSKRFFLKNRSCTTLSVSEGVVGLARDKGVLTREKFSTVLVAVFVRAAVRFPGLGGSPRGGNGKSLQYFFN